MTQDRNRTGRRPSPLAVERETDALDETARRAWTEPMAVRPFGDVYVVECGSGETHLVSLERGTCTCSRTEDDDGPCVHRRRVAIEIDLGRLPTVDRREVDCTSCGARTEARTDANELPLCGDCHVEPGDVVVDETGNPDTPLLVVSTPTRRAEEVTVDDGDRTVADYPGNEGCPAGEPVVDVVYPRSISSRQAPRRYTFPVSRLSPPPEDGCRQAALSEFVGGWVTTDE